MALRAASFALAAACASATIVSDGGWPCIFNANGVRASAAQRNMNTPALSTSYDGNNLGCAVHAPVPSLGGAFPYSGFWCIVDQTKCPAGPGSCGQLYPTIGYIDSCDNARTTGFGVVPNAAVIDPAQQSTSGANAYTFFAGQSVTLFFDRNQPTVLADELLRISVFNPTTAATTQITSTRVGFNISGVGAT